MSILSKMWNSFKKSLRSLRLARSRAPVIIGGVPWAYAQKVESDYGVDQETYRRIFRNEPFVRGPVGALVDACIKSGWRFVPRYPETDVPDGKLKTIKDFFYHPEVQFPVFLRNLITNLVIYDDVYVEIAKEENGAKNIIILDSEKSELNRDVFGTIEGMTWMRGAGKPTERDFEPHQFVHITANRLGSAFYGISDLETIVVPATVYRSAVQYNKKLFENAGIPTLAYLVRDVSDEQFLEIEKKLKDIQVGDNILLMGDINIEPISLSSKDLEYAELLNTARREMMSVLRVPTVVIGYESKTSLEGARTQLNTFGFRVNGIQQIVENAIDRIILKLFGPNYVDIRFELNEYVEPYLQAQIDGIYLKWGVVVPNEVRDRLGLKPRKGGNVPYTPATTIPGQKPRKETSEDGQGPDTNIEEQRAERQDREQGTPGK